MMELLSVPAGFFLLWFDIGLLLMIFGEYWFTVRKGQQINITAKYIFTFLILSCFGPIIINRIITTFFEEKPMFLTYIDYNNQVLEDTIIV